MRQTPAKGAGNFCPRKLSAWKRCTGQLSMAIFSWQDHQTLPICQAIFTVGCDEKMSLCSHTGIMKCCGISKAIVILPVINACVLKHLGGACLFSTEILWARMSGSDWGGNSRRVPLWCVTLTIHLQKIWSLMGLVLLTHSCQFSQRCLLWWMRWGWEAAKN